MTITLTNEPPEVEDALFPVDRLHARELDQCKRLPGCPEIVTHHNLDNVLVLLNHYTAYFVAPAQVHNGSKVVTANYWFRYDMANEVVLRQPYESLTDAVIETLLEAFKTSCTALADNLCYTCLGEGCKACDFDGWVHYKPENEEAKCP